MVSPSLKPFKSHSDDVLWKFKIEDWFDESDPIARDILMLLAADEDLMNIERLKDDIGTYKPENRKNEIAKTKIDSVSLFLLRLRLGFLHNVFKEIINKTYNKNRHRPSLKDLVEGMGPKVRTAYETLLNTMDNSTTVMKVIGGFRNQAAFHYLDGSFTKALRLVGSKTGKMIVNPMEKNVHAVVAYQVLDVIPAGVPSENEINNMKDEIDLLQGRLHAFIFILFDEYFSSRDLGKKIISDERPQGKIT